MASDRLGQRRGVEGLFQQGGKEHAGFGLLADLFGIGTQQQHRLAGHAWVQADLAGEVQTAAIGQPGVDDEEVVEIGLGLQQGAGLGQAGGVVHRTDQALEHGHGAQCADRVVIKQQAALVEERCFRRGAGMFVSGAAISGSTNGSRTSMLAPFASAGSCSRPPSA